MGTGREGSFTQRSKTNALPLLTQRTCVVKLAFYYLFGTRNNPALGIMWAPQSNSRADVESFCGDFAGLSSKQVPDSARLAGQPG